MTRLPRTSTDRVLDIGGLPPDDFERLCLGLVREEGFQEAVHYGARGGDNGRDIVARRGKDKIVFQCKRVKRFASADAQAEIKKILLLSPSQQPIEIIFMVTCFVNATTRDEATRSAHPIKCTIWALTDLDTRVRRHSRLIRTFFGGQAIAKPTLTYRVALWAIPAIVVAAVAIPLLKPWVWHSLVATRVAILPLVIARGSPLHPISPDVADRRKALAEDMTSKLASEIEHTSGAQALPADLTASMAGALTWTTASCVSPEALEQIRRLTGVEYVVSGAFDTFSDDSSPNTLTLCLQRTWDKRRLLRQSWALSERSMETIGTSLARNLRASLGSLSTRHGLYTTNFNALRLYFKGLSEFQRYDLEKALDSLHKAVLEDPHFYSAHYAYSRILQERGMDKDAQVEASKALQIFEHKYGDDRRELALLHAYSLVTQGRWGPAIQLYLDLWHRQPPDFEAAFLAVETENLARMNDDSLALIQEIRKEQTQGKLQIPLELDVRLDVEEAIAAARTGDTDREMQSANKALAQLPLDQERLEARARFLLCHAFVFRDESGDATGASGWPSKCQEAAEKFMRAGDRISYAKFIQLKAESLLSTNPECALIKDRKVASIFTECHFERGLIDQLTNLANTLTDSHLRHPQWQEARLICKQAIDKARETSSLSLPETLTTCAYIPAMTGDLTSAAGMYSEALLLAQQRSDELTAAKAAGNLAYTQHGLGNLQRALQLYEYSLSLSHRRKDYGAGFGFTLIRYARLLSDLGKEQEARKQYSLGKEKLQNDELEDFLASINKFLHANPVAWQHIAVSSPRTLQVKVPTAMVCSED